MGQMDSLVKEQEKLLEVAQDLSTYYTFLNSLNRLGMFDAAVLFENFALKVCTIWFDQDFENQNSSASNFPFVDLVSCDHSIFVQVSTEQDVSAKIKRTLENIRDASAGNDTNAEIAASIENLYFFMACFDVPKSLKSFLGRNRIGKIDFDKDRNLITFQSLLYKAKHDEAFLNHLYDILHDEEEVSHLFERFAEIVDKCKSQLNRDINGVIGTSETGTYEIDHAGIIEKIKKDNCRFISVLGSAGCGKSALCKKLVQNEKALLYARAEQVAKARDLSDVWNIDVESVLKYAGDKRIVFYIDALEFIADGAKADQDVLFDLYDHAKKYSNVFVLVSCRKNDYSAFKHLAGEYGLRSYEVPELTDDELEKISLKFPIIERFWQHSEYRQLLRIPFYLDTIVRFVPLKADIASIGSFRDFIFDEVMFLGERRKIYHLSSNQVKDTIDQIVKDRAMNFSSGVVKDNLDREVVNALVSENIITLTGSNLVRLKYDIFEDIWFERAIDTEFEKARGNYSLFFASISKYGRCIYRRYRIWVENKLFNRENRDKFLYQIIRGDAPDDWVEQTISGIVCSDFSTDFFSEYGDSIVQQKLDIFLRITNSAAFDFHCTNIVSGNSFTTLAGKGRGREELIKLLYHSEKYKDDAYHDQIALLCQDYARQQSYDKDAACVACRILCYFVDQETDVSKEHSLADIEQIEGMLSAIYAMAPYAEKWLKQFLKKLRDCIPFEDDSDFQLPGMYSHHQEKPIPLGIHRYQAEQLVLFTLNSTTIPLAATVPSELCSLADAYWISPLSPDSSEPQFRLTEKHYHHEFYRGKSDDFGLMQNAISYDQHFKEWINNLFLFNMARISYSCLLDWTIQLTNHAANVYSYYYPERVVQVEIIDEAEQKHSYFGCADFWMAGEKDGVIPDLIGDAVYILGLIAVITICDTNRPKEFCVNFANTIKKKIIESSNNVMMLSLIRTIGFECIDVIPGYALDLCSSIDLLSYESHRYVYCNLNEMQKMLAQQKRQIVNLPGGVFYNRYEIYKRRYIRMTLREYAIHCQISCNEELRRRTESLVDQLYAQYPDTENNAYKQLSIQHIDLRRTEIRKTGNGIIEAVTHFSNNAKKYIESRAETASEHERTDLQKTVQEANKQLENNHLTVKEALEYIHILKPYILTAQFPIREQSLLEKLTAFVLKQDNIEKERRSELTAYWVDAVYEMLKGRSHIICPQLTNVLFQQTEYALDTDVLKRLKYLCLLCLISNDSDGIVEKVVDALREYSSTGSNPQLSHALFNTILALYGYFDSHPVSSWAGHESLPYDPISQLILRWPDGCRSGLDEKQIQQIVDRYLYNEENLTGCISINECTISLCCLAGCGLKLSDHEYFGVMKQIITSLIYQLSDPEQKNPSLFSGYTTIENALAEKLRKLDEVDEVLALLFDDIDFSRVRRDAFDFYYRCTNSILPAYFDAKKSKDLRRSYQGVIEKIEKRIVTIPDITARNELSGMLLLNTSSFYGVNWNKFSAAYSFQDKMFLNRIWSAYGKYHVKEMLEIIYQMHIHELLPEVLTSVRDTFSEVEDETGKNGLRQIIEDHDLSIIINEIITDALISCDDKIKEDRDLSAAYEELLMILQQKGFREAGVLLDEFKTH